MLFCALFRLINVTTMGKNVIFHWFCFPHVVQKQTLGEVGNWMAVQWPVVSGIFFPKTIKVWSFLFKLQWKMFGMFFLRHSVVVRHRMKQWVVPLS